MSECKRTNMMAWFKDQVSQCQAREQTLSADHRPDEAVFSRIERNVLDIFRAVLETALQGKDPHQAEVFFLEKLETIPSNWKRALEKAKSHGDPARAHLERIKIETAARIRVAFSNIWRDNP